MVNVTLRRRAGFPWIIGCGLGIGTLMVLAACGNSGDADSSAGGASATTVSPLAPSPTFTGTLPTQPAAGTSRASTVYDVMLKGEGTGDNVAITVFEPTTLVGGQTYPLVIHSHGYSASRQKSTPNDPVNAKLSPGSIDSLLAAGYGAISISERGSDESTGTIRVMDPDYEGKDLISVLDWAENNLPWLMFRTGITGDAHNPVMGSIGGSYGGMYQYLINNIDPRHRLDAMVTQIAPSDLTFSLFPHDTIKASWDGILFGIGDTAGDSQKANTDPFITNFFVDGLSSNVIGKDGDDFFYYHSNQYFCGTHTVAGNGTIGATVGQSGSGTKLQAGHAPVHPVKTNALIFEGMRDTLFNFNNAYDNYQCLKQGGGDVRLLSYQYGHNFLEVVPDPGNAAYQPKGNEFDNNCGSINVDTATVAFFDEYLKGIPGAANKVVPTQTCLSLTMGDAVLVDTVTTGHAGKEVDIPSTMVTAGGPIDVATAVPLGITAAAGDVIGGIPRLEVDVAKVNDALPGEPILFVGLGQTRNGVPNVYDLLDNQITPLRGTGHFAVDLVGIAERLSAGDQLALLIYGQHDQYHITGTINVASPAVVPVTVTGKVWVPMLGNLANQATQ